MQRQLHFRRLCLATQILKHALLAKGLHEHNTSRIALLAATLIDLHIAMIVELLATTVLDQLMGRITLVADILIDLRIAMIVDLHARVALDHLIRATCNVCADRPT